MKRDERHLAQHFRPSLILARPDALGRGIAPRRFRGTQPLAVQLHQHAVIDIGPERASSTALRYALWPSVVSCTRLASRPRLAASRAQLGGGGLSAVQLFLFLPGRDPHDLDRHADHVGGALLAFRAARHQRFHSWMTSPNSSQIRNPIAVLSCARYTSRPRWSAPPRLAN